MLLTFGFICRLETKCLVPMTLMRQSGLFFFFFYLDLSCLCVFASCMPSFFYMLYVASCFYVPYVPYVLSFITRLKCLHFLYAFRFFTCLHFIYVYVKKTDTNKGAYLLLFTFAIIEFSHLSTFIKYFRFCKTHVIFCMIFPFLKRKILISFNAEENI